LTEYELKAVVLSIVQYISIIFHMTGCTKMNDMLPDLTS